MLIRSPTLVRMGWTWTWARAAGRHPDAQVSAAGKAVVRWLHPSWGKVVNGDDVCKCKEGVGKSSTEAVVKSFEGIKIMIHF